MKTLVNAAQEAFNQADEAGARLDECWEAAAQAVRAAVIEECAKVCDAETDNWNRLTPDAAYASRECASLIRSLK
jgi:hypothetical protein